MSAETQQQQPPAPQNKPVARVHLPRPSTSTTSMPHSRRKSLAAAAIAAATGQPLQPGTSGSSTSRASLVSSPNGEHLMAPPSPQTSASGHSLAESVASLSTAPTASDVHSDAPPEKEEEQEGSKEGTGKLPKKKKVSAAERKRKRRERQALEAAAAAATAPQAPESKQEHSPESRHPSPSNSKGKNKAKESVVTVKMRPTDKPVDILKPSHQHRRQRSKSDPAPPPSQEQVALQHSETKPEPASQGQVASSSEVSPAGPPTPPDASAILSAAVLGGSMPSPDWIPSVEDQMAYLDSRRTMGGLQHPDPSHPSHFALSAGQQQQQQQQQQQGWMPPPPPPPQASLPADPQFAGLPPPGQPFFGPDGLTYVVDPMTGAIQPLPEGAMDPSFYSLPPPPAPPLASSYSQAPPAPPTNVLPSFFAPARSSSKVEIKTPSSSSRRKLSDASATVGSDIAHPAPMPMYPPAAERQPHPFWASLMNQQQAFYGQPQYLAPGSPVGDPSAPVFQHNAPYPPAPAAP